MTPGLLLAKLALISIPIYWSWRLLQLWLKDVPRMQAAWDNSRNYACQVATNRDHGTHKPDHRRWYVGQLRFLAKFALGLQGMLLLIILGTPDWGSLFCNTSWTILAMSCAAWSPLFTSRAAYDAAVEAEEKESILRSILGYLNRIRCCYGAAHVGDITPRVRKELSLAFDLKYDMWVHEQLHVAAKEGFVEQQDGDQWLITETGSGYVQLRGLLAADPAGRT